MILQQEEEKIQQELKRKDTVIASLKKAVIELNKKTKIETRKAVISAILSTVNFKTEQEREQITDILTNSNLTIEFIKDQYTVDPCQSTGTPKYKFYL